MTFVSGSLDGLTGPPTPFAPWLIFIFAMLGFVGLARLVLLDVTGGLFLVLAAPRRDDRPVDDWVDDWKGMNIAWLLCLAMILPWYLFVGRFLTFIGPVLELLGAYLSWAIYKDAWLVLGPGWLILPVDFSCRDALAPCISLIVPRPCMPQILEQMTGLKVLEALAATGGPPAAARLEGPGVSPGDDPGSFEWYRRVSVADPCGI
eukprot:Skav216938  [mRNA]  locus=scaffold3396:12765:30055:+ [translate_table: standard]